MEINASQFIKKGGVSDATLIPAARDMYEFIERLFWEAGAVGNERMLYATRDLLAKARGEV